MFLYAQKFDCTLRRNSISRTIIFDWNCTRVFRKFSGVTIYIYYLWKCMAINIGKEHRYNFIAIKLFKQLTATSEFVSSLTWIVNKIYNRICMRTKSSRNNGNDRETVGGTTWGWRHLSSIPQQSGVLWRRRWENQS